MPVYDPHVVMFSEVFTLLFTFKFSVITLSHPLDVCNVSRYVPELLYISIPLVVSTEVIFWLDAPKLL